MWDVSVYFVSPTVKLLVWTLAAVWEEERRRLPGMQTQDLAGQRQGELSSEVEKRSASGAVLAAQR